MTAPQSDLDVVLPRQRPPSEPRTAVTPVGVTRRQRGQTATDLAKCLLAVLAYLGLLAFVLLLVASAISLGFSVWWLS